MNGRTNAKNGAGAIRDGCAVLEIRAPAYSQITAVRADGLTKKQDKGYVDLSNSDYWFYYIIIQKFELSGLLWTVTATYGTYSTTVTDTVIIDSNKKYYVMLGYEYYFRSGLGQIVPFEENHQRNARVDFTNSNIHMYWVTSSYTIAAVNTVNKVDLSEITSVVFDVQVDDASEAPYVPGLYIIETKTNSGSQKPTSYIASVDLIAPTSRQFYELDVSSFTSTAYISYWGIGNIICYNIYGK